MKQQGRKRCVDDAILHSVDTVVFGFSECYGFGLLNLAAGTHALVQQVEGRGYPRRVRLLMADEHCVPHGQRPRRVVAAEEPVAEDVVEGGALVRPPLEAPAHEVPRVRRVFCSATVCATPHARVIARGARSASSVLDGMPLDGVLKG